MATGFLIDLTERGLMPDPLIRIGIRRLLARRLVELRDGDPAAIADLEAEFLEHMRQAPVALVPELANEQHYEVPTEFFLKVLGPRLKYSCCFYEDGDDLAAAETRSLRITAERAGLADGQRILEMGCGWGSLSLYMAETYPEAKITAVSNSRFQREHIEAQASARGLNNLTVITADMNDFEPDGRFDRAVSLEMFEHMRNWPELFSRVARWLVSDGRFLMHVFAHAGAPYPYEDRGPGDWMSRHFFSGGMMPSDALAGRCQDHLQLDRHWRWSGRQYSRTLEDWLRRMDARKSELMPLFRSTYGEQDAGRWWVRWRLFFLACSELFAYRGGNQWWVSHYRFAKR